MLPFGACAPLLLVCDLLPCCGILQAGTPKNEPFSEVPQKDAAGSCKASAPAMLTNLASAAGAVAGSVSAASVASSVGMGPTVTSGCCKTGMISAHNTQYVIAGRSSTVAGALA